LSATLLSASQINLTRSDLSSDEINLSIVRSPNDSSRWTEVGTSPANTAPYSSTSISYAAPYHYRVPAHRAGDN
jgi:hypothetical protein